MLLKKLCMNVNKQVVINALSKETTFSKKTNSSTTTKIPEIDGTSSNEKFLIKKIA